MDKNAGDYDYPDAEMQRELSKLRSSYKKISNTIAQDENRFKQLCYATMLGASTAVLVPLLQGVESYKLITESNMVDDLHPPALDAVEHALGGNFRILQLFIDHGLYVDHCSWEGKFNALMHAVRIKADEDNAVEVARMLLQSDRDAVKSSVRGVSPLMAAAKRGSSKLVRLFLDSGACALKKTPCGKNALYYAHYQGHDECARLIEEAMQLQMLAAPVAALARAEAVVEGTKAECASLVESTKEAALKRKRIHDEDNAHDTRAR